MLPLQPGLSYGNPWWTPWMKTPAMPFWMSSSGNFVTRSIRQWQSRDQQLISLKTLVKSFHMILTLMRTTRDGSFAGHQSLQWHHWAHVNCAGAARLESKLLTHTVGICSKQWMSLKWTHLERDASPVVTGTAASILYVVESKCIEWIGPLLHKMVDATGHSSMVNKSTSVLLNFKQVKKITLRL